MPNIHMVCSVKGGSGKTAYALHKAVKLALDKKRPLYIDADVHASETCRFLYKKFDHSKHQIESNTECYIIQFDDLIESEPMPQNYLNSYMHSYRGYYSKYSEPMPKHYLNSYMHSYRGYYSKYEEIMLAAKVYEVKNADRNNPQGSQGNVYFDPKDPQGDVKLIFSDPSKAGRAVFGNIFQTAGRSSIGVGAYIAKARDLLNYVTKNCDFSDIVVDMPPGSDTFSDHLVELIVELSKENKLIIYYVANDDIGHIRSSASAACSHLHAMRSAYIFEVCLVYNRVRDSSAPLLKVEEIRTKIKKLGGFDSDFEHELNRIATEVFERDALYYNSLRITADLSDHDEDNNKLVVFDNSVLSKKTK